MRCRNVATLAAIALIAGLTASGAQAQGFTFGGSVSGDAARAYSPDRATRKAPARRCRTERYQVYDAKGQLSWRAIQICG